MLNLGEGEPNNPTGLLFDPEGAEIDRDQGVESPLPAAGIEAGN